MPDENETSTGGEEAAPSAAATETATAIADALEEKPVAETAGEAASADESAEEPHAESAFDKWIAELRQLPTDQQRAALERYEETLSPEERAQLRWNRKEEDPRTETLKAQEQEQQRTSELGRRKTNALQLLTTHLEATKARFQDRETDPAEVKYNTRGIAVVLDEFANAEGELRFDSWRKEVANAIVDEIEAHGEPLTREDMDRIAKTAGENPGRADFVRAHVQEAIRRGSAEAVSAREAELATEFERKLKSEVAARVAEAMRDLSTEPAIQRGGTVEKRPDAEVLLDPSTPLETIREIRARQRAAG